MPGGDRGRGSLPERVAQLYYTHGVFIAAHPFPVIATAIALVLLSCIPLVNLPLPSNVPQQFTQTPNESRTESPRWYSASEPPLYIQQVIMKGAVSPWSDDMLLTDAIRAPLSEVFRLVEAIQNYQHPVSGRTLADVCVRVEMPIHPSPLPQYNCLLVSPANFWYQDPQRFFTDTRLAATVYDYQSIQVGKVTLAELLFGLGLKEAGMKRYPVRNRQRVIQFAVTILLAKYDNEYIDGLHEHLKLLYPLHQDDGGDNSTAGRRPGVVHLYYPGDFDFHEFLPLFFTYLMLFFYMYFSVRKIELVRSKVGMALSAVFTVVSSLVMSIGLCLFFGLDPAGSSRGREVFPYLVVVVGLENILVLTKSVVSTQAHLDAKIRVAQGLSKEGWSITKNLLTEVTILTAGLLTLVPAIQEFCIFAMVGLLCDFFLQVCFFATVLSLDIRRIEADSERRRRRGGGGGHHHHHYMHHHHQQQQEEAVEAAARGHSPPRPSITRSRSTPRLQSYPTAQHHHDVAAHRQPLNKIPKRLKLVHFWASTRIVQRAFMLCMVVWIGGIVYSAGIIKNFVPLPESDISNLEPVLGRGRTTLAGVGVGSVGGGVGSSIIEPATHQRRRNPTEGYNDSENDGGRQKVKEGQVLANYPWARPLAPVKWCYLVSIYNSSAGPCRLAVLPPLRLAAVQQPATAKALRNPLESPEKPFKWHSLAQALDPTDYAGDFEGDSGGAGGGSQRGWETPFLPTSPLEVLLVTALCVVSVLVIAYTALALYHCVCSRNYAQWRSAWGSHQDRDTTQVVLQAMPLILEGHGQYIELLSTDGTILASCCLAGEINVWDVGSGERLAHIDRKLYFASLADKRSSVEFDDQVMSDYESGSPPSDTYIMAVNKQRLQNNDETESFSNNYCVNRRGGGGVVKRCQVFPDLTPAINIHFQKNMSQTTTSSPSSSPLPPPPEQQQQHHQVDYSTSGFDYGDNIRRLYSEMQELDGGDSGRDPEEEDMGSVESLEGATATATAGGCAATTVDYPCPQIWCMDTSDNLIAVGTSSGRLEFWEATTGKFKCTFDDNCCVGVTCVKLVGSRVVVARLNGSLEVFIVQSAAGHYPAQPTYRRLGHVRAQSAGRAEDLSYRGGGGGGGGGAGGGGVGGDDGGDVRVMRATTIRAHQQPITVLEAQAGRIVTGSHDHTLKVFNLVDQLLVFTLHGHCGPITALFIDSMNPLTAGSGSQDGTLCVWDLLTGACVFSLDAHDGPIVALAYSASYVISLGGDQRLCVWDRFQGHQLNTIQVPHTYCTSMAMLTHNLLIASKQGSLVVWDVRDGDPVRMVKLGHCDGCVFVRTVVGIGACTVACDYANQVRIVRFPLVTDKVD